MTFPLFVWSAPHQLRPSFRKGNRKSCRAHGPTTRSPPLQSHELVASLAWLRLTLLVRWAFDLAKVDKTLTDFVLSVSFLCVKWWPEAGVSFVYTLPAVARL